MRDGATAGDGAIIAMMGRAVERVLSRVPLEQRDEALRVLRDQLGYTLANAPIKGPLVAGIGIRARLAAAFAACCPVAGTRSFPGGTDQALD